MKKSVHEVLVVLNYVIPNEERNLLNFRLILKILLRRLADQGDKKKIIFNQT